jgi:hypothetical protein
LPAPAKPDSHLVAVTVFLQICDGAEIPFQGGVTCPRGSAAINRRSSMSVPDLIGLVGVVAYLSAYGLLQLGILKAEDLRYALLNALGALLILYSLIFDFNLASFVTQAAWLVLTPLGYIRSRMKGRPV